MKVLFHVDHSFAWAHGGVQNLVQDLMQILPKFGIEAEPLRWWDKEQKGDIIHTFYKANSVLNFAKNKGIKIVSSIFLDGMSSSSKLELMARKYYMASLRLVLKNNTGILGWDYGQIADAYIYPCQHEVVLGNYLYNASIEKSFVALYGIEEKYFSDNQEKRNSDYLISVNTIHPRKNNIQLARMAKVAKVPIKFIGKPYSEDDEYFKEFMQLVDNKYVIYEGFISEEKKRKYLLEAKGMVTLSKVESGCIAVLEAYASNCPVLLPDLAWAKSIYDGCAFFCDIKNESKLSQQLLDFYNDPYKNYKKYPVKNWELACKDYIEIYKKVLA